MSKQKINDKRIIFELKGDFQKSNLSTNGRLESNSKLINEKDFSKSRKKRTSLMQKKRNFPMKRTFY